MDWRMAAKRVEGMHTLGSLSRAFGIKRSTAVTYIHFMRENGFVETRRGRHGKRLYDISPVRLKIVGFPGFVDVLNKNSPLKIQKRLEQRVHGKEPTIEETIIYALKEKDSRILLASLPLFKKVKDWSLLYSLAKKEGLARHVGAFYSLARKHFRVARADKRILRRMKKSNVCSRHLIGRMGSKDFRYIEKEWGVFIPFNNADLNRLRREA